MAFMIKKRVDLSGLGDGWQDCYINFKSPTYKQISELSQDIAKKTDEFPSAVALLIELFIDGKGFDGEKVSEITKDDISELPLDILTLCFTELAGQISPKVQPSED